MSDLFPGPRVLGQPGGGLARALQFAQAPPAGQPRQMLGPGVIPGKLNLNAAIAPTVPEGMARPFAPGEWVANPGGGWSSEMTMTVMGDPSFNSGQATVIPSLWLKDGKPYVAASENEAIELAKASGLQFPAYPTLDAAKAFANQREATWQGLEPEKAGSVPPLWMESPQPVEQLPSLLPKDLPLEVLGSFLNKPIYGENDRFPDHRPPNDVWAEFYKNHDDPTKALRDALARIASRQEDI